MARLASRSMGVLKIEAFLVSVGEICAIVSSSYLTPSFPFLLCVQMWHYFRRALSNDDHSAPSFPWVVRLVRGVAVALTLMLPFQGWSQDPVTMTSAEVLKQEEHQRILGVVPNFNTVESSAGVPSLSPEQKFHLMYKSSIDPFVFVADAFVAGLSQARNTNPGFGQGAEGYFKRFGASYLDTADGNLWGNAILPIVFKEDPRYMRLGSGTFTHRFLYSAATTVWCKRDNGTWGPNYANVLGNFISGGISNAYYPAADRGFGQTVDGALTVTAEGVIGAEFVEFWPDISRHLFKKHQAAQ